MKSKKWTTLKSKLLAKDRFLEIKDEIVELPSGIKLEGYKQIKSPDVVIVFAITKDGNVVMIREYKHGARKVMLTMPAGLILNNETPSELASRELEEETGYQASKLIKLATLREYPTKMQHKLHIFLAPKAHRIGKQKLEASEDIEVELVSIKKLKSLVTNGEIEVSSVVSAIFLGLQKLKQLD